MGQLESGENVGHPDLVRPYEPEIQQETCDSIGRRKCSSNALCEDTRMGYCCKCNADHYGNGINCWLKNYPARVAGSVNGRVNDEEINAQLQSYIVLPDGRSYTAVNPLSEQSGYALQTAQMISNAIGWLFASPKEGAINGYQVCQTDQSIFMASSFTKLYFRLPVVYLIIQRRCVSQRVNRFICSSNSLD